MPNLFTLKPHFDNDGVLRDQGSIYEDSDRKRCDVRKAKGVVRIATKEDEAAAAKAKKADIAAEAKAKADADAAEKAKADADAAEKAKAEASQKGLPDAGDLG